MPTNFVPNTPDLAATSDSAPSARTASTLERIALYNELTALRLPQVELLLNPLALSAHYGSLELSSDLGPFELTCPDLAQLWQLPELAAISSGEPNAPYLGLPAELLLAALETNLKPYLEALSTTLGVKLEISAYRTTLSATAAYLQQSFYCTVGTNVRVPLTLSCSESSSAQLIQAVRTYHDRVHQAMKTLERLAATPLASQHQHELGTNPMLSLTLILGSTQVSLATLKSLHLGDALLLSECYLPQDEVLVSYTNAGFTLSARAHLEAGQLVLQTDLVPTSTLSEEPTMADQAPVPEQSPEAAPPTAPSAEPLALDGLKLKVNLVLDEQVMSLAQLQELKQGSVVPLVHHDLNHVALVVNGQTLAYGRVVTLGSDFAVQLTELAPAQAASAQAAPTAPTQNEA